jgi:hypothetical protein
MPEMTRCGGSRLHQAGPVPGEPPTCSRGLGLAAVPDFARVAIVAAATVALIGACSSQKFNTAQWTSDQGRDSLYLTDLRAQFSPTEAIPDADLLETGGAVCEAFHRDASANQVVESFVSDARKAKVPSDVTGPMYAAVVSSVVPHLCPQYFQRSILT